MQKSAFSLNPSPTFGYDPFLASGLEISPLKLPLSAQIQEGPAHVFEGLFGVFNDSLPDGWGKLLADRTFIEDGRAPSTVSAIERLSLVGQKGNGALIYEPITDQHPFPFKADLDLYAQQVQILLNEGQASALDELYLLGGNSVGARP